MAGQIDVGSVLAALTQVERELVVNGATGGSESDRFKLVCLEVTFNLLVRTVAARSWNEAGSSGASETGSSVII
ncbi:hypothetical protein HAV15_005893 [Penicillium sp. str. |nr:hypothetical protein HAV15_005893 [Penicillium sp. str. \